LFSGGLACLVGNSIPHVGRYDPISSSNHLRVLFRQHRQAVVLVGDLTRIPEPRGDHVRRPVAEGRTRTGGRSGGGGE